MLGRPKQNIKHGLVDLLAHRMFLVLWQAVSVNIFSALTKHYSDV
ncbi:hypothetical protein ALT785_240010 [Alteromonas infernus]